MAKAYYGEQAVEKAAEVYGVPLENVSPIARHIIIEEGYREDFYEDTGSKKEKTTGVGQTQENIGKNFFTEVLPVYIKRAENATKNFETLPEYVKSHIVSMAYRGDWGPKTKKLLKEGRWEEAADEYLDHNNYKKGTQENATKAEKAVADRMKRNADALKKYAKEKRAATARTFPEALQ